MRERLVVGGVADDWLLVAVRGALADLETLHRRHVERARQVVEDCIQQRLHTLVLEA
jgi:hypothetical protein